MKKLWFTGVVILLTGFQAVAFGQTTGFFKRPILLIDQLEFEVSDESNAESNNEAGSNSSGLSSTTTNEILDGVDEIRLLTRSNESAVSNEEKAQALFYSLRERGLLDDVLGAIRKINDVEIAVYVDQAIGGDDEAFEIVQDASNRQGTIDHFEDSFNENYDTLSSIYGTNDQANTGGATAGSLSSGSIDAVLIGDLGLSIAESEKLQEVADSYGFLALDEQALSEVLDILNDGNVSDETAGRLMNTPAGNITAAHAQKVARGVLEESACLTAMVSAKYAIGEYQEGRSLAQERSLLDQVVAVVAEYDIEVVADSDGSGFWLQQQSDDGERVFDLTANGEVKSREKCNSELPRAYDIGLLLEAVKKSFNV